MPVVDLLMPFPTKPCQNSHVFVSAKEREAVELMRICCMYIIHSGEMETGKAEWKQRCTPLAFCFSCQSLHGGRRLRCHFCTFLCFCLFPSEWILTYTRRDILINPEGLYKVVTAQCYLCVTNGSDVARHCCAYWFGLGPAP